MKMRNMKRLGVVFMALGLLTACGGGSDDLQSWMDSVANDQRGKIPPLPKVKVYVPLAYTAAAQIDPFDNTKLEPEVKGGYAQGKGAPNFDAREARNNIMERYPLESMTMIGYLDINNQPMAVISFDGMAKQVKLGDWIGMDFGRVVRVTDQEIELEETTQDANGDWVMRSNSLQLQAGEGGK
ncbi:MAG: pilus assembly protein PilP [Zoogloeaceae bacterium]|jgi:type IV pilus assembly protein PilP|nr:pilus assembly protein PilP [Zoogloeaceae bacterium]